ncbi:cytochrome c [Sphingomonas sp. JC676]|uniref:c-type cytochrome n=1 Tax=Sphingomonas sp. JC676 TaxID=2768065 RepID=UPI001657F2BF|nr:cytochrome c [Sphingomonas sp. JC676]MBC9033807.1 cytochrome c [Sphingomonas sp. JC676]
MLALALGGCGAEKRPAGPDQPQSAPNGPGDRRIAGVEANKYQVGQGGRYFSWNGCGACHGSEAHGVLALGDDNWRGGGAFDQVYRSIANHPGRTPSYGETIPAQQLWQITAYVRSLKDLPSVNRHRQDVDQAGEPQGSNWSGPVL